MEDSEHSLRSLMCDELTDGLLEPDLTSIEIDSEYIEMLIHKEINLPQSSKCETSLKSERSWSTYARTAAVKWILDKRALFGFRYGTAYLSLIYFDRFFSKRSIDNGKYWAVRLLSIACLSLAAKMQECEVPLLSEYRLDEFNFSGNVIQRMELLVLNTLEWKMSYVTPLNYLDYFISKFWGKLQRKEIINEAIDLLVSLMEDVSAMQFQPSIFAAAVVLAARDCKLTENELEIKLNAVPLWGSIEKERVCSCYCLLRDMNESKSKTPKSLISPNLLPTHSSSIDDPTFPSTVGIKRRLTYVGDINNDDDQNVSSQKIHKPE